MILIFIEIKFMETKTDFNVLQDEPPNMVAAVNTDAITERLLPKVFCQGDDLEKFIKRCEIYFDAKGITQKKDQERLTSCMID